MQKHFSFLNFLFLTFHLENRQAAKVAEIAKRKDELNFVLSTLFNYFSLAMPLRFQVQRTKVKARPFSLGKLVLSGRADPFGFR